MVISTCSNSLVMGVQNSNYLLEFPAKAWHRDWRLWFMLLSLHSSVISTSVKLLIPLIIKSS